MSASSTGAGWLDRLDALLERCIVEGREARQEELAARVESRLASLAGEQLDREGMADARRSRTKAILDAADGDGDTLLVLAACVLISTELEICDRLARQVLLHVGKHRTAFASEYPLLLSKSVPRRSEEVPE